MGPGQLIRDRPSEGRAPLRQGRRRRRRGRRGDPARVWARHSRWLRLRLRQRGGAISEGFGDYWAVDFSDVVAKRMGVPELEPLPCVMDWDATFYTSTVPHCLRRLDTNLHSPADL